MSGGYHHGDLRNALIAAGLGILERDGPEALSLRACAASAGVSHAAPKNHFADVRRLRSAIAAEGFRRHRDAMRAAVDNAGPARAARLRAAGDAYIEFAVSQPKLFTLMFAIDKHAPDDPELLAASRASYAVLEEVTEGLRYERSNGLPNNLAPQLYIWSLVHGFAHIAITARFGPGASGLSRPPTYDDIAPTFEFDSG
ncbi:MAG: TetR/AcrR family transcriptional regulator [Pseudomonadota bacterium]